MMPDEWRKSGHEVEAVGADIRRPRKEAVELEGLPCTKPPPSSPETPAVVVSFAAEVAKELGASVRVVLGGVDHERHSLRMPS